jgi:hypothetical protein
LNLFPIKSRWMKYWILFIAIYLFFLPVSAQEVTLSVRLKSGILAKSKNLRNQFHLIDSLKKFHFKNRFFTLIQFNDLPDESERLALSQDGIILYDYIPDNSFLAEVNDKVAPGQLKKNNIAGIYTLHATAKISSDLVQELKQATRDPDEWIAVSFYGSIDKTSAIAEFKKAGAQIIETAIQPSNAVFIDASAAVIQKIAALPFVSYISSQNLKLTPLDYRNRGAHAVNALSALAGRNLQGVDVTVGIGDLGFPGSHIDLAGRLLNANLSLASDHPTLVAGIVAGGGNLNPRYKGMAPEASIVNKFTDAIITSAPQLVTDYNMVLTNNSYGKGLNGCRGGGYNTLSNYIDAQAKNYPTLLHVFASGNEGDDAICTPYPAGFATVTSGYQSAKNVLTIGAIDNFTYTIANFSSRGPVTDGRLKPELVAGGNGVASPIPDNKYTTAYGTSCSAPVATGILSLLYERYKQLHGGSNPSSALIKAVACNGAVDMGNPGPDYTFGFGNINARNSVEAIENNTWFTGTLNSGGSNSYSIPAVPAGTAQIKILLYWNDPAASVGAASALVNNLDLTVTTPDATVHYPLVLNPAAGNVNNVAAEGIDNRNNIEQIIINNPPAGNCTVTINGTGIAQGPQDYVVVYQIIQPGVKVEYPFGEETLVPGETDIIRWSASDANNNTFNIEYSLNNGSTWITIDNNVAATNRSYTWMVPASISTTSALIRVNRNSTAYTDVSDYSFVVLDTTTVVVTDTTGFAGSARLLWSSIPGASSYDVMMLRGKNMQVITNTTNTSYSLNGLSVDSTYWVAVRGVAGTIAGRRSTAQCINPKFPPPDLTVVLFGTLKGRKYTNSQLGIVKPQVLIVNQTNYVTSGSASVSYQVNNDIPVTETVSVNLAPYALATYTFAADYDFSNAGNYNINVWIDYPGDTTLSNDTTKYTNAVMHLPNDPIVMDPFFTEGFESAVAQTYNNGTMGFNGLDRCDFYSSSFRGRARTFVDAAMVRTGNRAVTLDQDTYVVNKSADSLITTFNLSNYTSTGKDLWFSLYFRNEGIDFSAAGNKVWIRGSDRDAWIPVYTLPYNPADFGVYRAMPNVNITQALAKASPKQTITSSFQIKCGQEGYDSVRLVAPGVNNNGFTFDDIIIGFMSDDVGTVQLVEPTAASVLSANQSITVQVKNYNPSATITNVPVSFKINSKAPVTENIPAIAPGATINYTFTRTADLSDLNRYTIEAWTNYSTDTFPGNDTVIATITKISVNDNLTITVKPNPVTQGVLFINSTANCSRIEMRDVTGRLIKTASVNGMQTQLPVHDVAKGIYFITVVTDNGSEVKKVLIK